MSDPAGVAPTNLSQVKEWRGWSAKCPATPPKGYAVGFRADRLAEAAGVPDELISTVPAGRVVSAAHLVFLEHFS
jgi:hypothetical protein